MTRHRSSYVTAASGLRARGELAAFMGAWLLTSCAAPPYQAAPIAPAATASAFRDRTLADPRLRPLLETCLGRSLDSWPPAEWDLQTLSLAAWYFNPALDQARARIAESQAAVLTAGARPNPSFGISPGIPSPYLLTLELSVPIETAGKRGYRIEAARNLDLAARLDLAESAWSIRSAVRAALLDYRVGSEMLDLLRSEADLRGGQVNILEHMRSAGEIRRVEVDAARTELSRARMALRSAEEQTAAESAALAAAIGLPVSALREMRFSWPDLFTPPSAEALSPADIERDAVLNRLDVRSSLATYAAAEAQLQLAIAKRYPDVNLGPGYTYEEARSYFTVGLSATLPLFDRNEGPIAEAEARRRMAAAAFVDTQSQVILKSERALAAYTAALKGLEEAVHLASLTERERDAARQSVRVGEQDGLDLADAEIAHSVAMRARLEAAAHAQRAIGELEDAVQRPLQPGGELPREWTVCARESGGPGSGEIRR